MTKYSKLYAPQQCKANINNDKLRISQFQTIEMYKNLVKCQLKAKQINPFLCCLLTNVLMDHKSLRGSNCVVRDCFCVTVILTLV